MKNIRLTEQTNGFCHFLFYLTLLIYNIDFYFSASGFIDGLLGLLNLIEFTLLFVTIIMNLLSRTIYAKVNDLILIILCAGILIFSYYISRDSTVLTAFLFLFASMDFDLDEIVDFDFKCKIVLLVLLLFFIALGITANSVLYRSDGTIRNTLGFSSSNRAGMVLMMIAFEWSYLKRKQISMINSIVLFIVGVIIYFFINSRTAAFCVITLALLLPFHKMGMRLKKICCYLAPIFTFIWIALVYLYGKGNSSVIMLDRILSSRIKIAYNFNNLYGITLFGGNFEVSDIWNGYVNYLDNAYFYLLIYHGIIVTCIVLLYYIYVMKKSLLKDENVLFLILSILLLYGNSERTVFSVALNIFILSGNDIIYDHLNQRNSLADFC